MARCKACDANFTDLDAARTNPYTGEPEDLCGLCLRIIKQFTDEEDEDYGPYPETER